MFGTDLPVEGGKGGEFAWRDGPLLAALKAGHWVVLDEVTPRPGCRADAVAAWLTFPVPSPRQLNLASQSVLEGLNACFDHRAEVYIPELAMSFQVQHEKTKIFACQNPFTQGGGRKGLPKSFLNRFTQVTPPSRPDPLGSVPEPVLNPGDSVSSSPQVFVDQLTGSDIEFIGDSMFPSIDKEIISKMVAFNNAVGSSPLLLHRCLKNTQISKMWSVMRTSPFLLLEIFNFFEFFTI